MLFICLPAPTQRIKCDFHNGQGSRGNTYQPTVPESTEDQKREQRARLIKALSRFKPRDASPLQFYNCVRELCIMHNCSIDEGLERAALTWPGLSMRQRELYDSVSESHRLELPFKAANRTVFNYNSNVTQNYRYLFHVTWSTEHSRRRARVCGPWAAPRWVATSRAPATPWSPTSRRPSCPV